MIYSASRRTDLVAFHPAHIEGRVARSRKLEALVLWTKDPRNLVARPGLRGILARVPTVVQLTLTGLGGGWWEPSVPEPERLRPTLAALAEILPPGAVRWRFDPILVDETLWTRFARARDLLTETLGAPEAVTVSFPDPYRKVVDRLAQLGASLPTVEPERRRAILERLATMGPPLDLCCEPAWVGIGGARAGRCIDTALFDRLYGTALGDRGRDKGQRSACGCSPSTDIGSYAQACGHGCRYCYANPEAEAGGDAPRGIDSGDSLFSQPSR